MIRDPKDLPRYNAAERANHWVTGICFILLALSGLAFFHPAFYPLVQLFGGGAWARIIHPYLGVILGIAFVVMFFRFWQLNLINDADRQWLTRVGEMIEGNDHNMPEQGKYNAGQKMVFWSMAACVSALVISGLLMWRAYVNFPVGVVRLAAVVHAVAATVMDPRRHRACVCGNLDEGHDPSHVVRHGHPRLGQTAPPGVVPANDRKINGSLWETPQ